MPLDPLLAKLEQNIAEDIRVEGLAEAGFLSRAQLYREFYDATGHCVKEYVRKRRLSRALALIKHTDTPLALIAQECGFSSQQALCKGVKAATGRTPLQYKAGGDEYFFPACDRQAGAGRQTPPVTVSTETIPPTLRLRYYDSRLRGIENRALARLFAERPGYRGRIFGRSGPQEGPKLCYELYIEQAPGDAPPDGFARLEWQPGVSGAFAKISCPNTEPEINAAWDYLYDGWLKTSMFTVAARPWGPQPWFEEYIHAGGQIKRLALFLPVQKKPGFHKIRLCRCDEMYFLAARKSGKNAEEAAAKAVMEYLAAHHPYLAQSARQFYVSKESPPAPSGREEEGLRLVRANAPAYTCGIALRAPLELPPGGAAAAAGVRIRTHAAGTYAVLEGDCCSDSEVYQSVLAAWMDGMDLRPDAAPSGRVGCADPFAVYEAGAGFDEENVRVKIYQAVKNDTN